MPAPSFAKADALYDLGRYEEAFQMFLALAEQGDLGGMNRVAVMYSVGQGTPCNFEESIRWDKQAAELGDVAALLNLGISYRRAGDVRQAKCWFEQALAKGDGEAALELAKMYLISELETQRVIDYLRLVLSSSTVCEDSLEEAQRLLTELTSA